MDELDKIARDLVAGKSTSELKRLLQQVELWTAQSDAEFKAHKTRISRHKRLRIFLASLGAIFISSFAIRQPEFIPAVFSFLSFFLMLSIPWILTTPPSEEEKTQQLLRELMDVGELELRVRAALEKSPVKRAEMRSQKQISTPNLSVLPYAFVMRREMLRALYKKKSDKKAAEALGFSLRTIERFRKNEGFPKTENLRLLAGTSTDTALKQAVALNGLPIHSFLEIQRKLFSLALLIHKGKLTSAAKALKISERHLERHINKLALKEMLEAIRYGEVYFNLETLDPWDQSVLNWFPQERRGKSEDFLKDAAGTLLSLGAPQFSRGWPFLNQQLEVMSETGKIPSKVWLPFLLRQLDTFAQDYPEYHLRYHPAYQTVVRTLERAEKENNLQTRAEARINRSIYENPLATQLYNKYLIFEADHSLYTKELPFEAPVLVPPLNDRAKVMLDAGMAYYRKVSKKHPDLQKKFEKLERNTTILALDMQTIFFYPSKNIELAQIFEISTRRKAILISKKFLESLSSENEVDQSIVAYILDIAQALIDHSDELDAYFDLEGMNRGIISDALIQTFEKVEYELNHPNFRHQSAIFGSLGPATAKNRIYALVGADNRLRELERLNIKQEKPDLLRNFHTIEMALNDWDEELGYTDEEEIEEVVSPPIARFVPQAADMGSNQLAALHGIKQTLLGLQKVGFAYELEGQFELAHHYYEMASSLYNASQKIDFGGYQPLQAQEQRIYFLMRTGRLESFEKEFNRLLNLHYLPTRHRKAQKPSFDFHFPLWMIQSAPDLLFKLQFFRRDANEERLKLINRIQKMLLTAHRKAILLQPNETEKFSVDLTAKKENELHNPYYVSVTGSEDLFAFSWLKAQPEPDLIEVRVEAFLLLGGPERRRPAGYFDFALHHHDGTWQALPSSGFFPRDPEDSEAASIYVPSALLDEFDGIAKALLRLGRRLTAESRAGLTISLPKEAQDRLRLRPVTSSGKPRAIFRFEDPANDPALKNPVNITVRPRAETRIDRSLEKSAKKAATVFVPYEDIKNRSELRESAFAMAYEVKDQKNTRVVIYGADLLEESLKPLRDAGIKIVSGDLSEAWQQFGQKERAKRNVHVSTSAERLKENLGNPALAFLSQRPEDIYAALLLARSDGQLPRITMREQIYFMRDYSLLQQAVLRHQNDLVVRMAA